MRKRTGAFRLLSGFFSLLAIGTMAYGQAQVDMVKTITQYSNPPGLAAGTPEGSYVLSAAESMDSFGGHLNYELPLLHIGGRGSAGYTISLKIPSRWEASSHTHCDVTQNFGTVCTPTRYEALFGDWRSGTVEYGPGVVVGRRTGTYGKCTYLLVTPNAEQYRMTSTRTTIVFIDSHGSEHELFDTSSHGGQYVSPTSPAGACAEGSTMPNRGKIFASRDGSALTFLADSDVVDNATLTNGGVFSGRLLFPDGTVWRVNSIGRVTYIRDRFGNLTTFEYSASIPSELVKVTDPEGREVSFSYSQTLDTITYRKYLGGTHTISVGFAPLENVLRSDYASTGLQTYHELFSTANDWCAENSRPRSECLSNPWVPSLVTLPNSKLYQFRYNPYAELSEVLLPTGGRTEYDWAGGEANALPDGYLGFEDLALIHRVVKQRRAYIASSGGTPAKETFYEPGSYFGVSASRVTTEAQRSLSAPRAILHYFNGSPTAGSFLQPGAEPYWNHGKEYYTEIQGGGSTSKKTDHEWVQLANLTPVLKSVTTKLPRSGGTEIWSKVENWYDSFANIVQTTETDWGSGAVGPVIRKKAISYVTATNYTHEGETNPANYVAHLRRLPLTETVYKVQSGVDTQQARREYVYDEAAYPVQTCSGISRHDTSLPPSPFDSTQYLADNPTRRNTSFTRFGNVTTARAWTAGSNYINTRAVYDIAGNTVQMIDGNTVTTTATYPSTNACAYPSAISISGTQTITASMQWDLNIGKMTSHTDVHNVITNYGYEQYLGRMNSRTAASGTADANTASLQYSDAVLNSIPPFTVTSKQDLTAGVQKESSKEYDGLGRLVWERQKTGGADIVVKTEYDALGRVSRRSIPAAAATQWEEFTYDALDRVTRRKWDDDAQEQTAYQLANVDGWSLTADITKVTDPAGKWRIMVNDGLGRLIQVREPNPNNPSLPLDTTYTYNALDNLLTVSQSTPARQRTFTYDGLGRLQTASNPESGSVCYGQIEFAACQPRYDGNGNLLYKTDARGAVTAMLYDELNRMKTKTYSGGPTSTPNVTYTYSGLRLMSVSTSDGITQAYTYTNGGRLQTSTQTIGSTSYPFSYVYNKDGSLASVTYPSGRLVTYELANSGGSTDLAGRVHRVKSELGAESNYRVKGIDYNEHGLMGSMTLGNNLVERWTYSPKRLQPYDIRLGTSTVEDSAGRWKFSYCAGALAGGDCTTNNGNVMNQQIQPLNIFQNYGYDVLNRISVMEESASASASPACGSGATPCRAFGYDDWSNMYVSATRVMSRASFTPASSGWFDGNNRLTNSDPNINPQFDLAGNLTDIGGYDFAYDHEGRVKTSTLNSIQTNYTYDGNGRRVTKSTGGSTTTFVYDASGNLAAEYGGTVTETGARYLTADHLGSTRLVTKQDQSIDRRIDYLPFGEFMPATVGGRTTAMKYEATETLAALTQRFTGKERDAETGLDYMDFRYYGGAQGRFMSPDPLMASANVADPQSWNRYVYARNNPLRYTDPLGLFPSPAYNCSEGQTACLNDDQRRILENSKVKVGDKTLSGEALWNAVGKNAKEREAIQNAFVNITDRLASISTGDGKNALNGVASVTGLEADRIKASISESVFGAVKGSSAFESVSGALHPGFDFASFKSKDREGNIQFSFAPPGTPGGIPRAADIDHDLFNDWRHGLEVIQNHTTGGKTNQDSIRQILVRMPGVGITPSTDSKWNRRP